MGVWLRVTAAALPALVLAAPTAHANGRFPASQQLVFSSSDPNLLVLRTTYGVLVSHDQGCNWDWVCETAILGTNASTEDPFLGLTSAGTILAPYVEGLAISPDTGCSWSFAGGSLAGRAFADLALEPGNPHAAVTLASTYSGQLDGGQASAYATQLFASTDDGVTWTPFGAAIDPSLLGLTVDLAPSDARRVYVSAVRGDAQNRQAFLLESTDAGATFTSNAIPIQPPAETGAYIAAVDPSNADRLYVRTQGTATGDGGALTQVGRLLVTPDAGKTWDTAYTGGQLLGFALSSDGSKVYLGGPTDGLLVAPSSTVAFSKVSAAHVQCLATRGASLYVCSDEVSGYVLGQSENDGANVTPLLHIDTMRGPLACGPATTEAQCVPQFASQAALLGGSAASGSCAGLGLIAATGTGGGGGGAPASSGCSCRASGRGGLASLTAAGGAVGAFLFARVRRRRRSTHDERRGRTMR